MEKLNQLMQFLSTDIWRIRTSQIPRRHSFWITQLRILLVALRGFVEDRCQLRASALTFYTLLSVVPVLAMAFGFARGFGFDQILQNQIIEKLPGQKEVAERIIFFTNSFLEHTKGGLIAGVGVAILFWTVIKVLNNIEQSFNEIWGIKKGRTLARQFSDYLAMLIICPTLLIISGSMMVAVTGDEGLIAAKILKLGAVGMILIEMFHFLPYIVMWMLFTFIYMFMPNTTVAWGSALIGGVLGGTLFQLLQWGYIKFMLAITNFGAVYGSFAALPLFLVWLQVSWLIVLFGAEISFAQQNVETYEFEPDSEKVSPHFRRLITLIVARICFKKFQEGATPVTAIDIAHEVEIPVRLVNLVIFDLTEAGVLSETRFEDGKSPAYQPARDISDMTIQKILSMIDRHGTDAIPFAETEQTKRLRTLLESMDQSLAHSPKNVPLKDI